MKVIKFGGSSLATGPQFEKVIHIIQDDSERKIIVTSAPGKRFTGDTKVTDLLIQYANQTLDHQNTTEITNEILRRYQDIANYFNLDSEAIRPIKNILLNLPNQNYPNNDYLMATFKSTGERLNGRLMSAVLNHLNISAQYVRLDQSKIRVSDNPNNADVLPETYDNLSKLSVSKDDPTKLIFPGFAGLTKHNQIVTFARGGSDITGSILARGLGIQKYENFTDVNAIYAANPNIVHEPMPIKKMTYREMRELSYAGFNVFNDEAIIPAIEGHVTVQIKNTNNPQADGTTIVPEKGFTPSHLITGVASSNHFIALYLHKYLLNKQVGFTLKILQILYKYNISYEHMPSGIDDLTIIFDERQLSQDIMCHITHDIKNQLNVDQLNWIKDYAIIMVVGEGMQNSVGAIDRVIQPLANKHIGVQMINQGASRISMMIGTKRKNANEAVKRIYNEFLA